MMTSGRHSLTPQGTSEGNRTAAAATKRALTPRVHARRAGLRVSLAARDFQSLAHERPEPAARHVATWDRRPVRWGSAPIPSIAQQTDQLLGRGEDHSTADDRHHARNDHARPSRPSLAQRTRPLPSSRRNPTPGQLYTWRAKARKTTGGGARADSSGAFSGFAA